MKSYKEFSLSVQTKYDKSKRKKADYKFESDDILTFDTETSSAWMEPSTGKLIPYTPGKASSYWNNLIPYSICYIWQFSFNDTVYYGRTIEEFLQILDKLDEDTHYIIWVHNLAFDFMVLNNIIKWSNVFARQAHKPIKAVPADYPNVEFRCSYQLTHMSLDTWGKELNFPKLHTLEYTKLRTPNTKLEEKELEYAERDCMVIFKGIEKFREQYKHIERIPLTQTGRVRREVKRRILKNRNLCRRLIKLIPRNAEMYGKLKQAFMGGYTHANFNYVDETQYDGCAYDFTSSYPTVMVAEKFPMTPFEEDYFDETQMANKGYLMKVRYTNIKSNKWNHYISLSKSFDTKNVFTDNGRIISADTLTIWITELDYQIIKASYNYDNCEVLECYSSWKEYLPTELVQYVLELYSNKTMYKDVEGKEEIYAISKQFINSLFGMCVTDLVMDTITYDNQGQWGLDRQTIDSVNDFLDDLRDHNKGRTFLAYQWGIWITAYARLNLWKCLLPNDSDVIYCDTDSLKIKGEKVFDTYNKEIIDKLEAACEFHGIDKAMLRPVDSEGVERPLGIFDRESDWTEFKTLGAKRYCYRSKKDGELHLTVSGINKDAVYSLNNDIENFNPETSFDKDFKTKIINKDGEEEEVGVTKKLSIYLNEMAPVVWNEGEEDEYSSTYQYGICLRPNGYDMSMASEFIELLMTDRRNFLECISGYEDELVDDISVWEACL